MAISLKGDQINSTRNTTFSTRLSRLVFEIFLNEIFLHNV